MSDIVERLRQCQGIITGDPECNCQEAAAEIKRMRAALKPFAALELDGEVVLLSHKNRITARHVLDARRALGQED